MELAQLGQTRTEAARMARHVGQAGELGVARTTREAGEAGLAAEVLMHARRGAHGRPGAGDVGAGDDRQGHLQLGVGSGQRAGDVVDVDDAATALLTGQHRTDVDEDDTHEGAHVLGDALAHEGLGEDDVVGVSGIELEDGLDAVDGGDGLAQRELEGGFGVNEQYGFHVLPPGVLSDVSHQNPTYYVSIKSIESQYYCIDNL